MRFDDRIATVLALPETHAWARTAKWRQLVDLLAQAGAGWTAPAVGEAIAFLRNFRETIPRDTRRSVAVLLAGRSVAPPLIAFFAEDLPAVVAPLIAAARLSEDEWMALLPRLTPTARALLRNRRDLPSAVTQGLASFGPSDFALTGRGQDSATVSPALSKEEATPEHNSAQIRDLVARIEAFRKQRPGPALIPALPIGEPAESFRWETGSNGLILWVDGVPRGPLIGQTIATIADPVHHGVDGQAAGAFEKRAPFRDARLSVAGRGPAAGDWRISGVPFFDLHSGAFLGYRGSARRPRVDEVARPARASAPGLFGTEFPADSLRQLIHELRTPLNAIVGFAEMIEGEYMGSAHASYRAHASDIMEQAGRLLSAVDDLDTAARLETSRLSLERTEADVVALLCRLHDAYERVASQRSARLTVEIEQDLPSAKVEEDAAERMFARVLAATIGLAGDGEVIAATMGLRQLGPRRMLCLKIDRPRAIAGLDEAALLDPGYSPDGDWPGAPALGLGFALRLVRNLAEAAGGALSVGSARFALYLPPADTAERSRGRGG